MKVEHCNISDNQIYIRHRLLFANKPTVFFIHGVGESGRCFYDAVNLLPNHNLVIPDLLGFGKSEKAVDERNYSFLYQIKLIKELIEYFDLRDVTLVAHSWGGMLGTLLCQEDKEGRIAKYVCVEGGISKSSTIMSLNAIDVLSELDNDMEKFGHWLKDGELKRTLLEDLESSSTLNYYDSLLECDPKAFALTSKEICEKLDSEDKNGNNEISLAYKEIKIPKIYVVGTRPVMNDAMEFLNKNNLDTRVFGVASHWIMLDKREEFYSFLNEFIAS